MFSDDAVPEFETPPLQRHKRKGNKMGELPHYFDNWRNCGYDECVVKIVCREMVTS